MLSLLKRYQIKQKTRHALLWLMLLMPAHALHAGIHLTSLHNKTLDEVLNRQLNMITSSKTFKALENKSPTAAKRYLKKSLLNVLKPYGYFNAEILTSANNRWRLRLNQQTHFNRIDYVISGEGKALIEEAIAKKHWPFIHSGDPFSSKEYQASKNWLIERCEELGFIKAHFAISQVKVYEENHTADVILHLDTEKRAYFGRRTFSKTRYPLSLLKAYAPFKEGEPFSPDKLINYEQNLQNSPYFTYVRMTPTNLNAQNIPIDISLTEAPRVQYVYGGGYGTDTGVRGRIGIMRLFENGHTLQSKAELSQLQNTVQSKYTIPGRIPYEDETNLIANLFTTNYAIGSSHAALLGINQLKNRNHYQFEVGLNFLHEGYYYVDSGDQNSTVFYPSIRYSRFDLTSPLFSKKGFRISVKGIASHESVFSTVSLIQPSIEAKVAYWLDSTRTRLFFKANGSITDTKDIYDVPITLQQLLGGMYQLDAYQYLSIGPGKRLIFGRAEIQQETKKDWFITADFGIGDVYSPAPFAEKRSVGVGLMYASPIGLIKVGVAKGLDLNGRPLKLVFSMGPDL